MCDCEELHRAVGKLEGKIESLPNYYDRMNRIDIERRELEKKYASDMLNLASKYDRLDHSIEKRLDSLSHKQTKMWVYMSLGGTILMLLATFGLRHLPV